MFHFIMSFIRIAVKPNRMIKLCPFHYLCVNLAFTLTAHCTKVHMRAAAPPFTLICCFLSFSYSSVLKLHQLVNSLRLFVRHIT